jgi:pyruvate,orthophosphate dikinase
MSQLATKWVYDFGGGASDGDASMKNLLGGKGANLAEMAKLGLPVPPGFTITTEVCTVFYANKRKYPADLEAQVNDALKALEGRTARNSAMCAIRCSSPSAPARAPRCRA